MWSNAKNLQWVIHHKLIYLQQNNNTEGIENILQNKWRDHKNQRARISDMRCLLCKNELRIHKILIMWSSRKSYTEN